MTTIVAETHLTERRVIDELEGIEAEIVQTVGGRSITDKGAEMLRELRLALERRDVDCGE